MTRKFSCFGYKISFKPGLLVFRGGLDAGGEGEAQGAESLPVNPTEDATRALDSMESESASESIENSNLITEITKAYDAYSKGDAMPMLAIVLDNKDAVQKAMDSWAGKLLPKAIKESVNDFLSLTESVFKINEIVQKEGVGLGNYSKIVELGEVAAKDYMRIVNRLPAGMRDSVVKATKDHIMAKIPSSVPALAKSMIRSKVDELLK